MFCIKCGNPIGENDKFCSVCGAKTEEMKSAVENSVAEQVEVTTSTSVEATDNTLVNEGVAEPVVLNEAEVAATPKKKKSKKKCAIISSVIGVVVAAAAVLAVLFWPKVENFVVKTLASPESYYQHVESENIDSLSNSIAELVGLLKGDTADSGNVVIKNEIKVGDDAINYLAESFNFEKSDLEWLSKIGIDINSSTDEGLAKGDITLLIGENEAFGFEILTDNENGNIYFRIPEVNDKFFCLALDDGDDETSIVKEIFKALPDEKTTAEVVSRYMTVIVESIDKVSEKSVTIKANGVSEDCTKLTVKIDDKLAKKIVTAVCEKMLEDEQLEGIIKDIAKASEKDADEAYDSFIDKIEEMLDEADNIKLEQELKLNTYVNKDGEVIGREIEAEGVDFHYYSTKNGSDIGYELVIGNESQKIELLGEGEISNNILTAEYEVIVSGMKALTVKVENYDVKAIDDDKINGTFRVSLTEELCNALSNSDNEMSAIISILKDVEIVFSVTSDEATTTKMDINKGGKNIITFISSQTEGEVENITLPKEYESIDSVEDLGNYFGTNEAEKLLQKIIDAGLPSSFIQNLGNVIGSMGQVSGPSYDSNYGNDFSDDYGYMDDGGVLDSNLDTNFRFEEEDVF